MSKEKTYMVMATVETIDDCYDIEYTGTVYHNYEDARPEYFRARKDPNTTCVWIECYPDCNRI